MKREMVWVAQHVFMPNRKGRKQARKISRLLRKIIRRLEEPEHEYP